MRDGWKEILLSDHCCFLNGGSWSDKEYVEAGIPVIKVTNMVDGGISFNSLDHIPESSRKKYEKHILKKGDLVVATVGSHPTQPNSVVGRTSIIPTQGDDHLLNQNAVCVRVFDGDMDLHPLFLFYLTQTTHFKHYAATRAKGSANQVRLAISELKKYTFPAPPLPLQTRIADLLSAYDELIEVNNRRIALLEQTAEQLYKEWFVRLRFPGYAQTKVRKGVPEGWEVKPLKFFGKIITGKTPSKKVEHFYGTKFPFYKTPDIHRGVFINSTEEALSDTGLKEISSNSIPENSIMISCIGTAGVVAISSSKGATNQQINSIIPNESVYREYLYFVAKGLKPRIEMFGATGSTMINLSKGKLSKLVVLNPEKSIVNRFNQKTIAFFNQIQTLQAHNQTLRRTRDLLLPRLISGQLSVAEAETALNA
jgi:type I restriction enzyme S subunit